MTLCGDAACAGEREGDELLQLHWAGQCKPGEWGAGEEGSQIEKLELWPTKICSSKTQSSSPHIVFGNVRQELFYTNREELKYYPLESPPGTRLLTAFYTVYHGDLHRQEKIGINHYSNRDVV